MAIECLILGAGQEVGKSCVVVTINGKRIMFDCGMHMGYTDDRRYPDFSLISESKDFTQSLACIIITHFHLDHIGALPYFTEVCGYSGPIYMTYPTKALAPLMLEDFRKVMVDRMGEEEKFSAENVVECMNKVTAVDLKQTIQVDKNLQIRAYYAGHVLGAAMFYAKVGDAAMVYTGDYNMTPDRHLGAAKIERLDLDLVITESTYATTYRDSKYAREREFLRAVHKCVAAGGKVLIPTFALGRAQELCMLLDDYWERMNLKVPIYFSSGLTVQANMYYQILINWTSQKVKDTCGTRNAFDFKNVCSFDRSLMNAPEPCVLFATPGMVSGGFSLEVFKQWAPNERNLVMLPGYVFQFKGPALKRQVPLALWGLWGEDIVKQMLVKKHFPMNVGQDSVSSNELRNRASKLALVRLFVPLRAVPYKYCVAGTIGHKLMSAKIPTQINIDQSTRIDVRCQIYQLSFSPHTDAKGIIDLLKFLSPKNVILVHGEKPSMAMLKEKIKCELGINCYDPANYETVCLASTHYVKATSSDTFLESSLCPNFKFLKTSSGCDSGSGDSQMRMTPLLQVSDDRMAEGILTLQRNQAPKILDQSEVSSSLGLEKHDVKFAYSLPLWFIDSENRDSDMSEESSLLPQVFEQLSREFPDLIIKNCGGHLQVESFVVYICSKEQCSQRISSGFHKINNALHFCCNWSVADEKLAWKLIYAMKNFGVRQVLSGAS